jgi:hypothetical protein
VSPISGYSRMLRIWTNNNAAEGRLTGNAARRVSMMRGKSASLVGAVAAYAQVVTGAGAAESTFARQCARNRARIIALIVGNCNRWEATRSGKSTEHLARALGLDLPRDAAWHGGNSPVERL